MNNAEVQAQVDLVQQVSTEMRAALHPLLIGKGPEVQSAVIADLAATYLASLAPPLRPGMRTMLIALIDNLVPINERAMFGEEGHPYGRD